MACTSLIHGRGLDCNRISGGIKNIYFAVYDQITSFAYDSTFAAEIDTINFGSNDIYKYVMPLGVSSLTDTIVGSRENGTIYYTPSVNIILNRLTKGNGLELNAGTMDSGAAWGDRNGYTLTFDGMEATPFAMLEDYTTSPFDNSGITNLGNIVVA